jgi:K+-sensing histidine kinase KdpD
MEKPMAKDRIDLTSAGEARESLDHSWLIRTERLLSVRSRGFVIVIGLLLLALIGLIDGVTGPFAVSVFYFLPIVLVTFGRGWWMGIAMSAAASIAWSAVEVAQGITSAAQSLTYWNTLTRFYAFVAVCLVIAPMREALIRQRELAEHETAVAERLTALEELRQAMTSLEDEAGRADPRVDELFGVLHALDRDWTDAPA